MRALDLAGKQFARLLVLRPGAPVGRNTAWECECSCGSRTIVATFRLVGGRTQSCGCLQEEQRVVNGQQTARHGDWRTPEYKAWQSLKDRCLNTNGKDYHGWGARGITVDPRWQQSYETFLDDMGRRPSPAHSIDRKNNDGPYSAANCRWATRSEQQRNKRSRKRPHGDAE
jgi:hypothetical protein